MQQLHCKLQTMSSTHSVSILSNCGARLSILRCDTSFVDRKRAWGMAGGHSCSSTTAWPADTSRGSPDGRCEASDLALGWLGSSLKTRSYRAPAEISGSGLELQLTC